MPTSAVRNRIASFEAQSSPTGSSVARTPSQNQNKNKNQNNYRPGRTSIAAKKKRDALRQQQQEQQQQQQKQQDQERLVQAQQAECNTNKNNNNEGYDNTTGRLSQESSTTSKASENRKSRIRQSKEQQIRENVPNLFEKRRNRRVLQQRRLRKNADDVGDVAEQQPERRAGSPTPNNTSINQNTTPTRSLSSSVDLVPDSPGDDSNGSSADGTRWSKIQRMRNKGSDNNVGSSPSRKIDNQNNSRSINNNNRIVQRQSSVGTNVTTSNNSAVTSIIRNTSTANNLKLRGRNFVKGKTATSTTIDKMMSATVETRRQRQEEEMMTTKAFQSNSESSFNNHHHSSHSRSSNNNNNSNHNSNHNSPSHHSLRSHGSTSDIMNGSHQQQYDASLEAVTDDDATHATLTSVHQIMEESNNKQNHNHNMTNHSAYETLESQFVSSSSSRNNNNPNSTSQQASYDSSVGHSWQPSSSRYNRGGAGGGSRQAATSGDIFKTSNNNNSISNSQFGRSIWNGMDEEKSERARIRTASSSDYDTDGDISKTSRQSTHFVEGPSHSQTTDVNDFFTSSRFSQQPNNNNNNNNMSTNSNSNNNNIMNNNINNNSNSASTNNNTNSNRRIDDDERTFDYGDRDDDSNGGTSHAARRRKEAERRAWLAAASNDQNSAHLQQSIHQHDGSTNGNNGEPLLLNKEDMEQFVMKDTPSFRLSAGVAGVATMGCIVFGPVGLLIGVAAGGLGFGFMQIPEEERKKIQAKAEKAVTNLQEKACDASETMTSSCLNTYQDSGVADHVPHCISSNVVEHLVPNCPTGGTAKSENFFNTAGGATDSVQINSNTDHNRPTHPSVSPTGPSGPLVEIKKTSLLHNERLRNKKVACLRNVRILPIAQIHGLDPSSQPRAWLDVVASANTTSEQKNEATEEILLLAKDKRRAKIFLDEGILDYIIWTLSRYFEKLEVVGKTTDWANPDITASEKTAANLAALCCVTLGKAHCAAIHTEGDLLLMSMYERGTVPEERQVAQMLHEIPHHARVTKTNDPTVVQPSKEVFAPRQLSLSQAEELARSIKAVAEGQL